MDLLRLYDEPLRFFWAWSEATLVLMVSMASPWFGGRPIASPFNHLFVALLLFR